MSLATQFAGAIERTHFSDLNAVAQSLWKAFAAGHLDEATAQELAERIEARKPKASQPTSFRPAAVAPKPQRSPDKQASIERRRRLARASPVPPHLVSEFTQAEHAVLTVVSGELGRVGYFDWPHARTAAVAGTCKGMVRSALRKGRKFGLLYSTERRRRGQRSLTNLVRLLCKKWGAWLRRWIGYKKMSSTTYQISQTRHSTPVEGLKVDLLASTALRSGP